MTDGSSHHFCLTLGTFRLCGAVQGRGPIILAWACAKMNNKSELLVDRLGMLS